MSNPKPLTAWFGGKARMAPIIATKIENIPHTNFVEAFCGAAGVTVAKKPSSVEVVNDLHDGLIGLYRVVRNPETCQELVRQLELTPYA
jgi:DNA adenine methylase